MKCLIPDLDLNANPGFARSCGKVDRVVEQHFVVADLNEQRRKTRKVAERAHVEVRRYDVIYDMVEDVEKEMLGSLAPKEEEEIVELWRVEKQPVPTNRAVPKYPDIARKANITGKVFVTALVNKAGKVEQIGKITGPPIFHGAAKTAALKWEFEPAIQNDKPVKVWVSLPFTFQLK